MRSMIACLVAAAALTQAPAFADPVVSASMPVIRATVADGQVNVRLERGVLGAARSHTPRTLVVVARNAGGDVVFEAEQSVSRRMTYASLAADPALTSASTVTVSLR